jgi:hypothetical protein
VVTLYLTPVAYSLFDDLRCGFMANARATVAKRRTAAPSPAPES